MCAQAFVAGRRNLPYQSLNLGEALSGSMTVAPAVRLANVTLIALLAIAGLTIGGTAPAGLVVGECLGPLELAGLAAIAAAVGIASVHLSPGVPVRRLTAESGSR